MAPTKAGRSPMIAQYFEMKAKHPEAILLSRVGDFYEAYGDDAETIARALQIALTSKDSGAGSKIAMAGVPHHALDAYLAKLVAQRRVVALAEQLEVPVPNKLVHRDVVRVVTPGTVIEEHLLERGRNNYLAALSLAGEAIGLAYADVSTGRLCATVFDGESAGDEAIAELARISPAEIVADVPAALRGAIAAHLPQARVEAPALAAVEPRESRAIAAFSIEESLAVDRAVSALGAFLRRVGLGRDGAVLREPQTYRARARLDLDASARRHLDLTRASGANAQATLLATIDRTRTAMGSRLLARWIEAPLVDRVEIAARADRVAYLVGDFPARARLLELLRGAFDLERIAQKVRYRRATPRDLGSLRRTLAILEPLRAALGGELASLRERTGDFRDLAALVQRTLADDPPAQLSDGGVIRPEASAELAEFLDLRRNARARLTALEERERVRTGIKSLKVRYSSAFGYAIEVTTSNLAAVPADYVRRQTLANGERFITPELKELELAIASAESRARKLEEALFESLVENVAAHVEDLLVTADALAEIDVVCGLAEVASDRGYVRPRFVEESVLDVTDGRHPVVEAIVGSGFVPNDVRVGASAARFIVLTGPNMGGKSTYLRQTALLVILAQIGSFVPARSMTLGVVDRIFTRIGAGDDLASGQSTFYLEMSEASTILRRSTSRSLLLVDELGRGTSTIDGLAIAQAMCEYLLDRGSSAPIVLFATHFHELVTLADRSPIVANYHVTAVEGTARSGSPVFSHRVLPGSTSRSFGIEVARMAGMPAGVIARAKSIAAALADEPALAVRVPKRERLEAPDGREETQLSLEL